MADIRHPTPAKLIAGMLAGKTEWLDTAAEGLIDRFGPTELVSPDMVFGDPAVMLKGEPLTALAAASVTLRVTVLLHAAAAKTVTVMQPVLAGELSGVGVTFWSGTTTFESGGRVPSFLGSRSATFWSLPASLPVPVSLVASLPASLPGLASGGRAPSA